jgi:hypothetical protein
MTAVVFGVLDASVGLIAEGLRRYSEDDVAFLEISSRMFADTLHSSRRYYWQEATERLAWFKDIGWEAAKRRWNRGDFDRPS